MEKIVKTLNYKLLFLELQALRKGVGLAHWKLDSAVRLRQAIAEQAGIEAKSLTTGQVYTYLINEIYKLGGTIEAQAVRNAFAIDQEMPLRKLTERRKFLAQQLNRHADTVESYENKGIVQLANRLYDFSSTLRSNVDDLINDDQRELLHIERKVSAARNMITQGLSELYALGSHASEIHTSFGRHPTPYLDASVSMTFLPSKKGREWYNLRIRQIFRAELKEYRIGIVSSMQDCEILMASNVVDDVIKLNEGMNSEEEIEKILANCKLVKRNIAKRTHQSFYFKKLDARMRHFLLSSVWQVNADNCEIIEVRLPDKSVNGSELYEYHWMVELHNAHEQYSYWYAQGLMYLNHLTIDISRFPEYGKWRFTVLPFLGPFFPGNVESVSDHYTLATSGWVMQGQGVAIAWQQR